jgi:hypothetical protein
VGYSGGFDERIEENQMKIKYIGYRFGDIYRVDEISEKFKNTEPVENFG